MNRILLITSDFPPVNSIAVRRAAALGKYLARMSWDVTVLTAQPPLGGPNLLATDECLRLTGLPGERVLRTPVKPHVWPRNRLLKAFRSAAQVAFLPGSSDHDFGRAAPRAVDRLPRDLDVIWATYPFAGPLIAAAKLSKILGVPWIADFRDTPDEGVTFPRWFREFTFRRLLRVARSASAWIAVTDPMACVLAQRGGREVRVIPNGYDPEMVEGPTGPPRRDVFRMVYTGTISASRDVNPVISAVEALAAAGEICPGDIQISLYGPTESCIAERHRHCIGRTVHLHQPLPPSRCDRVQREATVLLVLAMPLFEGTYTGKLFEYMAAGRPVLGYPRDGKGIDRLLQSTGVGVSCNSVDELKTLLLSWYRQWKQTGDIATTRKAAEIAKWNRASQAADLAAICADVIQRHRSQR